MNKIILICLCVLFFTPSSIFAINCTDTITTDTILTEDLICNTNGLILNSNLLLDCNNHKIEGKLNGIGIDLTGKYNTVIKNCQINNFTIGIKENYQSVTKSNGWGFYTETLYSQSNLIENNIFSNNNQAITLIGTKSGSIKNNIFKNNTLNAINIDLLSKIEILENTFHNTAIKYLNTYDKTFCKNNLDNTYLSGASGPSCKCTIPQSNIIYDTPINFCYGEYYLPNGIEIGGGRAKTIDCNNATIYGINRNSGIKLAGAAQTTLKNCMVRNFEKGIHFTYKTSGNNMAKYNLLYDNTIYNSRYAIYMDNSARAETMSNNIIIGTQYHFYNLKGFVVIDAKNNWFGTSNETLVSNKIFDTYKTIKYLPIKLLNQTEDIVLDEINLNKTTINLKIDKKSFLNPISVDSEIIIMSDNKIVDIIKETLQLNNNENIINIDYNLKKGYKVSVLIDPENKIFESEESNNFIESTFEIDKQIYLNIKSNSVGSIEFEKYLKSNLGETTITQNKDNSNVEIQVSYYESNPYEFKLPYEGEIKSYKLDNKQIVSIKGVDIEGQITTLKEFISNKEVYLDNESTITINSSHIEGIKTFDYLHLPENYIYYKTQTNIFGKIIAEILNDNTKEVLELQVPVNYPNGTINYRMQKLTPKYSDLFKSYIDVDGYPIVMGGGLWSDITTWSELGTELANEGFEVYLIELTGGVESDCNTCYNYPYEFLTDSVYPAYINSVLNVSGKEKIKYVGHSNGARTALDSLSKGALNQNKVDTLIAVGVPGAFEGTMPPFSKIIELGGNSVINISKNNNKGHISIPNVVNYLIISGFEKTSNIIKYFPSIDSLRISTNLFEKYYYFIFSDEDFQPGAGIEINNFYLLEGIMPFISDGVVSTIDEREIFSIIQANQKYHYIFPFLLHKGQSNQKAIKEQIKKIIK